jgi:hypothetical protein
MFKNNLMPKLENAHVTLAPITGRAFTGPTREVTLPSSNTGGLFGFGSEPFSPSGASRARQAELRRKRADLIAAYAELSAHPGAPCLPSSEIIGALKAAGDRLRAKPDNTRKLIVVLSHGFEQSRYMNLYDYKLDLHSEKERQRLIQRVSGGGVLPHLAGVTVCMAGITAGDDDNADAWLTTGVQAFWVDLFKESGAILASYSSGLSGCPLE